MEHTNSYNLIPSNYVVNDIRYAMLHNTPIEDKLHVIAVMFNPSMLPLTEHPSKYSKEYELRYKLFKEFVGRMERDEPHVIVYLVELAYGDCEFVVTDSENSRHLQLRTEIPLWHRENLVNLGVKHLLPVDWKAMAWIDADLEFENPSWARDTLKILNGTRDIVHLYSHCQFIENECIYESSSCKHVFTSFGFNHEKSHKWVKPHPQNILQHWSHGFAMACTRQMYDAIDGLSDFPPLGTSMLFLVSCFNDIAFERIQNKHSIYFKHKLCLAEIRDQIQKHNLKLGYVPGTILHHFHGTVDHRNTNTIEHQIRDWENIMTHNDQGILIPKILTNFPTDFNTYNRARNAKQIVIYDHKIDSSNIHLYIRTRMTNDNHSFWGPVTWIFLHTVAQYWNSLDVSDLVLIVELILRNTPCERCSKDSAEYLMNHPFNITSQKDLIIYLFEFHNYLNQKIDNPLFCFDNLTAQYDYISFDVIYPVFIEYYTNKNIVEQQEAMSKITLFFESNKDNLL